MNNRPAVLNREEIMVKHGLTAKQFSKVADDVRRMNLADILYRYPEGVHHDIAVHLLVETR
jgi:hypothetical protein